MFIIYNVIFSIFYSNTGRKIFKANIENTVKRTFGAIGTGENVI